MEGGAAELRTREQSFEILARYWSIIVSRTIVPMLIGASNIFLGLPIGRSARGAGGSKSLRASGGNRRDRFTLKTAKLAGGYLARAETLSRVELGPSRRLKGRNQSTNSGYVASAQSSANSSCAIEGLRHHARP
jgi:hypothetical protein